MKILHINTYSTGGAATAVIRLHEALLKHGYDSKILFLNGNVNVEKGYYYIQPKSIVKKKFHVRLLNKIKRVLKELVPYKYKLKPSSEHLHNSNIEIFTSPNSRNLIEEHSLVIEADIIQLHWVANFLNWQSFFKKVQKPIFWYFHDMNPILGGLHYSNDLRNIHKTHLEKRELLFNQIKERSLRSAFNIYIQCNSIWLRDETIKSGRFTNAKNIETIHLSLDFEKFYPQDKILLKKFLGVEVDYRVILFGCENIGNKRKGLDLLIEAINLIEDKRKIILCTFGGGIDVQLETKGEFLVKNFGKIENLDLQRLVYSVADFFIIPSRQEAFGQTALESLACGTPVIGFKTGGIPDIIEDGVNGILVSEITPEALKDSIQILLENKQLLRKFTIASRNSVIHRFSQERQVKYFVNRYAIALSKK